VYGVRKSICLRSRNAYLDRGVLDSKRTGNLSSTTAVDDTAVSYQVPDNAEGVV
jgi:hypothetical protein